MCIKSPPCTLKTSYNFTCQLNINKSGKTSENFRKTVTELRRISDKLEGTQKLIHTTDYDFL